MSTALSMLSVLLLVGSTYATDQNITEGDVQVNIRGQSGKITFSKGNATVTVNFDYIQELDKDGNYVGATGKRKHSINTFAREAFSFKTSGLRTEYQNISVKHTQFEATISGPGAKLTVDIFIFKGSGNVSTSENETLEVKPGTIKFNIMLGNWSFCGGPEGDDCKKGGSSEVGTQVEFGIEIKGRGKPSKKSKAKGKGRKVETLDLGGADCTLSGEVNVDGFWEEMVSSYPKVETQGGKTLFQFRFPKFNSSVKYDPTVELSGGSSSGDNGSVIVPDKNMTEGDIEVNIRGQSGKMTFKGKKSSVTVNFDYIKELDKDGNEVGATGKKKHSINSFARESFSFKTSGMKTEYQNISVKHTQFEATISGPGAKLIVDIFIFKGSGNLSTSNDESLEVKKGDIKFNIKLESWTFCGGSGGDSCSKGTSSEAGTQVEFGIEIKGRSKPTKRSKAKGKGRKLETLDLGGADCTLSGAVNVDGTWQEMVSLYPKVDTQGAKTLFKFRFPKFNSSVTYDPTVSLSSDSSSGGNGSVVTQDKNMTEGDIEVNIRGQSGKMTFKGKKSSVTVNFDYIKELDNSGNEVGATGKKKHSINSFAREAFSFKTSGLKTEYQNISVKHTQFEATISGPGAKLTVDIFIFKNSGTVKTSNDESLDVKKGTIKFNIKIESWMFCGGAGGDSCSKGSSSEVGNQIEFGIEIKGRSKASKKTKAKGKGSKVETLDLGDADCTLSGEVDVDGTWQKMSSGFPKVEEKNSKQLFIFRFPKFSSSVKYDPTIDMSPDNWPSDSASGMQIGILSTVLAIAALLRLLLLG